VGKSTADPVHQTGLEEHQQGPDRSFNGKPRLTNAFEET